MTSTALDYAAEYARCFDWYVFPLHSMVDGRCTCGKAVCEATAKHPRTMHGLLDATSDQETIAEWTNRWPDANIGIATGQKSGFVALDIDPRNGGDENLADLEREHGKLPDTVVSLTGGGGKHYLFLWPGEYVKNCSGKKDALLPGVEIKGDGGYIVAPPSLHKSGQRYEWELSSRPGEVAIAPLPLWLLELLRGENKNNGREYSDEEPIKPIYEGARNVRLTSLAGTMRRRGMSEKAILAALLVVNGESCVPPLNESEVERIAHSVARYAPDNPPVLVLPPGKTECAEWVGTYVKYAQSISPMTPYLFHESAALWLVATAIARRLVLDMPFGPVYPNLYVLWLAETTLYRKTTGQQIPRQIASKLFPYLIAPQDCTPEAMLNDMAGNEPPNLPQLALPLQDAWKAQRGYSAQRGLLMDEMSGMLASSGRDYNAGLIEAYLRFYDCEENYIRSTRSQGWLVVRNAYVSVLGASTPAAMAQHVSAERLWAMGWWPRFAMLTPPEDRAEWQEPQPMAEPPELVNGIKRLVSRLPAATWPQPASSIRVTITAPASQIWASYNKSLSYDLLTDDLDHRLYGTYGRLPMTALKVAMILAAIDWPDEMPAPIIFEEHMRRAMQTTERWRESAHRAIAVAAQTEWQGYSQRILKQLSKAEKRGMTMYDLSRAMRDVKPSSIQSTLDELVLSGSVDAQDKLSGKQGGRPTVTYFLATH